MITRSNLAEQLREYQIRSKHEWATLSYFASTANSSSRVDVVLVLWELLMFAFFVFSGVALYFRLNSAGAKEHVEWLGVKMELSNAFCTFFETLLLSKDIMYFIDAASQGNTIGPLLDKPNSSSDILKSYANTLLLRYAKGTTNLFPSIVYTTK